MSPASVILGGVVSGAFGAACYWLTGTWRDRARRQGLPVSEPGRLGIAYERGMRVFFGAFVAWGLLLIAVGIVRGLADLT